VKTYLDCYPCFLRQALSAARRGAAPAKRQSRIFVLQAKCPVIAGDPGVREGDLVVKAADTLADGRPAP
jgi:uncharacterized protein with ATP-grasp and redox domains